MQGAQAGEKLENEKMGCEVVLEEWSCASEIKQNLNKIKATPCKLAEELLVWDEKAIVGLFGRKRKISEEEK